ncbi:low molecular weight phosphatase family protein [Herbiconiux moechotypicola]|uniref:protein-tyrosine-phosphatase n=1 Tax=Herbiconiux moechotypicola TaxID=637393 RepID=A0ABP5QLM7_9MICO|nr:low molecular weight phosphatase family protein [Herbiconiux moechotypicola]MCS5731499.1 low molecular weight phosphatase family protein [Herbiconiux moechotypicola]
MQAQRVRILTVCSGNICRSPLAELTLASRLEPWGEFEVSSAGSIARDGDVMPDEARALARRFGVDPEQHRARYLTEDIVGDADLIFAMARSHRSDVVRMAPSKVSRTFTIREFARLSSTLSDQQLEQQSSGDTLGDRVAAAVRVVFAQKAAAGYVSDPELDDVVDPYRRSSATYERSWNELIPAVEEVARVLTIAARAT